MANFADCMLIICNDQSCIVAVTSGEPDGLAGSWYTLHTPDGKLISHGQYMAWKGDSALGAMKLGKAAARRWLKRNPFNG